MRKTVLLPILALCALCMSTRAQGEATAIKLCGREFIRAIVYTCGGSRWRRIVGGPALTGVGSQEQDSFELLSTSSRTQPSRRDLNQLLTTMCCQVGCRKTDLAFIC
ncbi:hypothetical protein AGOR_G00150740 [Albula goreensis]|uniref:Insulin-like domain-containing protein n=1 Tax=Albula goreensis TaxID=1534307 RepID=A0A8T3DC41_9TELE|nr:hypothetical protein AGOR_G00150740 [Albula goreensis]